MRRINDVAVLIGIFALTATACTALSTTDSTATPANVPLATAVTTTATTPPPPTTATTRAAVLLPSVADFRSAADAAVAEIGASFVLETTQTIPGLITAATIRSGEYDDAVGIGVSTVEFRIDDTFGNDLENPNLQAFLGEPFEFRLMADTMWILASGGSESIWTGWEIDVLAARLGDDPSDNVNGDVFILQLAAATTRIINWLELDDGASVWVIELDADDLLPVVVTPGVQQRIAAAGLSGAARRSLARRWSMPRAVWSGSQQTSTDGGPP